MWIRNERNTWRKPKIFIFTILFQKIKEADDRIPVIVISGQEEIAVAVKLLKMGVSDYLTKDENTKDLLWNAVINARKMGNLKKEVEHLKEELGQKFSLSVRRHL